MFWGLVLKTNRKYTHKTEKSFHLSQAALDITSCSDEPVQVFLTYEDTQYLLCTLRKNKVDQVPLDLNFGEGSKMCFQIQGSGNVHLCGYLTDDDYDMLDEDESETEKTPQLKGKNKSVESRKQKTDESDDDDSDSDGIQANEEDEDEDDNDDDDDEKNEEGDSDDEESDDSDSESEEEVAEPKTKQIKLDKPKQNGLDNGKQLKEKIKKEKIQKQEKGGEKILQGGVKVEDIRVGTGIEAKSGKKVLVFYEGRLKSNNKLFDSTKQGSGFKFGLGKGEVIKGWDVGVAGMKVGGKRRITCPPHMAYGSKGSPPVIPPNSTLVFDVELKAVH